MKEKITAHRVFFGEPRIPKRLRFKTVGTLLILLFMGVAISAQGTDVGLDLSDDKSAPIFVDLMRTAREFKRPFTSEPRDSDFPPLDQFGWPLEADFDILIADLRNDQGRAEGIDPNPPELGLDGAYACSFKGVSDDIQAGLGAGTITDVEYNESTNTTTFTWNFTVIQDTPLLYFYSLRFRGARRSNAANAQQGITELKVHRPGYPLNTDKIFTDEWLSFVAPFSLHRYMNWSGMNKLAKFQNQDLLEGPVEVDWEDRQVGRVTDALEGFFKTGSRINGQTGVREDVRSRVPMPWEYVVEHTKITGKDAWINIPVHASDQYIRELAKLIKREVPSNVKLYLEYSNEIWNYSFNSFDWNYQKAIQEVGQGSNIDYDGTTNDNLWAARRYAKRTVEIGQIFQSEGLGQIGDRIRPVLSWFASAPGSFAFGGRIESITGMLQYIEDNYGTPSEVISAISTTGYFGKEKVDALPPTASVDDIIAAIDSDVPSYFEEVGDIAEAYGLEFTVYEGATGWNPNAPTAAERAKIPNRIRAERSFEIGEAIKKNILDAFKFNGGGTYVYFASHKLYTKSGFWATTDLVRDPFNTSRGYKYTALVDVIEGKNINRKPIIAQDTLEIGFIGEEYSETLSIWGGDTPLNLDIDSGGIPPGLSFNGNQISGTPTLAGDYDMQIQVTDANGDTDSKNVFLRIGTFIEIKAAEEAILVDGNGNDMAWASVTPELVKNLIRGAETPPDDDLSAEFKTSWDNNYFYVFIDVTDDNIVNDSNSLFDDDGVELYLDINNDKRLKYGQDDLQLSFGFGDPDIFLNGRIDPRSSLLRAERITDKGYAVELAIPWAAFGVVPEEGYELGFEVHVADDDDGGGRDHKLAYSALTDNSFENPQSFASGKLAGTGIGTVEVTQVAIPALEGPVVVDGELDAAWNSVATQAIENVTRGEDNFDQNDFSGAFRTGWDANNLYFFINVLDRNLVTDSGEGNPFDDDGYELFLDVGNDRQSSYGADDYQIAFRLNDPTIRIFPGSRSLEGIQRVERTLGNFGYVAEITIPWSSLGVTPSSDLKIGFDVALTDDDDGGSRDNKLAFNAVADNSFLFPFTFAEGTLVGNTATTFFKIKSKKNGLYLSTTGTSNGDRIVSDEDDGSDSFLWKKVPAEDGFYYLENKETGKYVRPQNTNNNAKLLQRANTITGQLVQWRDELTNDGESVYLINRKTGKFISPKTKNASDVLTKASTNTGGATRWFLEPASGSPDPGTSTFVSLEHQQNLYKAKADGATAITATDDGDASFQWEQISVGEGVFQLKSRSNGKILKAGGPNSATPLIFVDADDTSLETNWEASDAGDGTIFLVNLGVNKKLCPLSGADRTLVLQSIGWSGNWVKWKINPVNTDAVSLKTRIDGEAEFTIYPNPVRNTLFMEGTTPNTRYAIYDLTGRLVKEGATGAKKSTAIVIENLPAGMYILKTASKSASFLKE